VRQAVIQGHTCGPVGQLHLHMHATLTAGDTNVSGTCTCHRKSTYVPTGIYSELLLVGGWNGCWPLVVAGHLCPHFLAWILWLHDSRGRSGGESGICCFPPCLRGGAPDAGLYRLCALESQGERCIQSCITNSRAFSCNCVSEVTLKLRRKPAVLMCANCLSAQRFGQEK
jgi:hypothetical protein